MTFRIQNLQIFISEFHRSDGIQKKSLGDLVKKTQFIKDRKLIL